MCKGAFSSKVLYLSLCFQNSVIELSFISNGLILKWRGGTKILGNVSSCMDQLSPPAPGQSYFCSETAHHTRSNQNLFECLLSSYSSPESMIFSGLINFAAVGNYTLKPTCLTQKQGVLERQCPNRMCATLLGPNCTAHSKQTRNCSITPQEPGQGPPSTPKEAHSKLGSGRHNRVTAFPSTATALWAGLRDHPRPATADTAQKPELLQTSSNRSHRTIPLGFVSLSRCLQTYLQERHRMLTGCLNTKKGTEKFWLKA